MITTQSILSALGIGLSKAIPEAGDGDISIPSACLPTVKLQEASTYGLSVGNGSGTTVGEQSTSHIGGFDGSRTAGQGDDTNRVTALGPGLWRIDLSYSVIMPIAGERCEFWWQLATPSGSGGGYAPFLQLVAPGIIAVVTGQWQGEILVPKGYMLELYSRMNNTTGATLMNATLGFFANKLLS